MYTRRKFVIQGSMATTAILALKPFNAAAEAISSLTGLDSRQGKLAFLHTANPNIQNDTKLIQHIAELQNTNTNTLVLHAGQVTSQGSPVYDCCIDEINKQSGIDVNYKIIRKGNIRTGFISARPEDGDVIQNVNTLSAFLKKEKDCDVVVCFSQLGYKNNNTIDDITMAKQSTHLDFIIGGNTKNIYPHPVILLNQNNEEVIIHSSHSNSASFGKIDIDFNEKGQKRNISFSNS
jgi:2',3'-cyclic-nucleotide 2'-phosphodiesterase (5'-nucleotidase family)